VSYWENIFEICLKKPTLMFKDYFSYQYRVTDRTAILQVIQILKLPLYRFGQTHGVPGGWGCQKFRQSVHNFGKAVSPTRRPPKPHIRYSWHSFLLATEWTQDHIATGMIMSMKNPNENKGNRTRDLPACKAVPQATAARRTPIQI